MGLEFSFCSWTLSGLKYKGNLKNGLLGGLSTLITIGTANGIYNVVTNFDYIKQP